MDADIKYHDSFSEAIRNRGYNVPIYRYIPLNRLHELLMDKKLVISQTMNWDDTYENFLTKSRYMIGLTPVSYHEFLPGFYGQCWTLKRETDAMWRIYSHDKTGVRIKSRVKKVLEASLGEVNHKPFSTRTRIIGPVSYFGKKRIGDWIKERNNELINASTLLESLFIKRKEFIHEKEIRLIVHKNVDREKSEAKFLELEIEPNELIEEITFDPRTNKSEFEASEKLIRKVGFVNRVNRSRLYDFEPAEIWLNF